MIGLHITNLTGSLLSVSCTSAYMDVEHGSAAVLSPLGKRSTFELRVYGQRKLSSEAVQDANELSNNDFWHLDIQRPRALADRFWRAVHPKRGGRHSRVQASVVKSYRGRQQNLPWIVYTLHTQTESYVAFLPSRDMSSFLSELGDEKLLSDIALPGTHNSLAFYGWPVSQCQSPEQPLLQQFYSGIRVLDIRLSVVDGVLMAYHGAVPQRTSFSAILNTLYAFLQERPSECFVVSIKQEDFGTTPWWVFSRGVREEVERGAGGLGMWYLENRIPKLGEVRGKCIMLSRFGAQGQGWEGGLEGMGIHPGAWPDNRKEGFEWDLRGIRVKVHDWYGISSLLSLPEKASLCIQNLTPAAPSDPPTLGITFLSAFGALAFPFSCALGFGWPSWGLGVEGMNSRVTTWLLARLLSNNSCTDREKDHWSVRSTRTCVPLLGRHAEDEPSGPVRGWLLMDFFAEPDGGLVPLWVESNFIGQ